MTGMVVTISQQVWCGGREADRLNRYQKGMETKKSVQLFAGDADSHF